MLGYFAGFGFITLSAARDVWGFVILKQWPVALMVLISFSCAALIANLYSLTQKKKQNPYQQPYLKNLIALNITSAISWILVFTSMSKILPVTLASLVTGFLPICTLVLDRLLRGQKIKSQAITGSLIIITGIVCVSWNEFATNLTQSVSEMISGIGMALIASTFVASNNIFTKRLNDQKLGATTVFASRFWLIILITLLWVMIADISIPESTTHSSFSIALLGILGIAFPVFCLHIAIERIGPQTMGFLISSAPIIVFLIQYFSGVHRKIDPIGILGIILVVTGIMLGTKRRLKTVARASESV
jgi:drug/metabolite transporter (DMT)-like permease